MIDRVETEADMLDRHFEVLTQVIGSQPVGIVTLSNTTGYPKHKIRYSLRILEEKEIIEPTEQGVVTTDQASEFLVDSEARLEDIITQLETLSVSSLDK